MRTVDIVVLILLIISAGLATWAHFEARSDCLAMVKPKTDSTPSWRVSKLTGKYERIGGVLFCKDERGRLHAYGRGK